VPALTQFGYKAAQRKIRGPAAHQQPLPMLTGNLLRPVPTHFARRKTARLAQAAYPSDDGADPNLKAHCRLPSRLALPLNRRNNPFAKIHRVRLAHPC
jgi:hypothetical protein